MTDHGHPGWYSWLVVIGGSIVSMLVAVGISISYGQRQLESERAQNVAAIERERAAREAGRAATCLVIRTMADVYDDPSTETGRKAATAWAALGRTFGCKE